MPRISPHPGEIWVIDAGYVAKIRPCLVLTDAPLEQDLDLVTVVFHTTALRGGQWEVRIPKPFLKEGAFHLQEVHTAPVPRLERKLGELSSQEYNSILDKLAARFGL
jgi:mRNA interferase MazF